MLWDFFAVAVAGSVAIVGLSLAKSLDSETGLGVAYVTGIATMQAYRIIIFIKQL